MHAFSPTNGQFFIGFVPTIPIYVRLCNRSVSISLSLSLYLKTHSKNLYPKQRFLFSPRLCQKPSLSSRTHESPLKLHVKIWYRKEERSVTSFKTVPSLLISVVPVRLTDEVTNFDAHLPLSLSLSLMSNKALIFSVPESAQSLILYLQSFHLFPIWVLNSPI